MKKILLIMTLLLFAPSTVLASSQEQAWVPADLKVLINGQQIDFDQEPVIFKDSILLPLREVAEALGATVSWDWRVIIKRGSKELILPLGTKKVIMDYQIFFMEQVPVVINGHTMVSLRFISEALGADLNWDEKHTTVNIVDNGKFAKMPDADPVSIPEANSDKYYKFYHIMLGPDSGPGFEEAKSYVLEQGLLTEIWDIQRVYTRFINYGPSVTMVSGIDEDNEERLIWLGQDRYIGEISIRGTVLKNSGLSQEEVLSILQENGLDEASIKELYIGPSVYDQIVWFAIAKQGDKHYYSCVDFFTGAVEKNVVNKRE